MTARQRRFNYSWGSGIVVEEARVQGEHHSPSLQLLKYTEGPAEGAVSIRFCHYGHDGHFRRSPLLMSSEDLALMRDALAETPELKELLLKLLAD